ncbi:MAG TPA: hypothetical protein PLZ57_05195 [Pseudobdellovibrionaceae bacterium]|nr:hypothetical protein [Pseudobdellovibrionaceae bacterium]
MKNVIGKLIVMSTAMLSLGTADATVGLKALKTFDGQVMRCENRGDQGRIGYRIVGTQGVLKANNLEVSVDVETLKCVENSAGQMTFSPQPLSGRNVNLLGGFIEFKNLEFVVYTPDFQSVNVAPVSLGQSATSMLVTIPAAKVPGLLSRNSQANGESRAVLMGFLRGQADMGDARTGEILDRSVVPFGSYNFLLSDKIGNLTIAR